MQKHVSQTKYFGVQVNILSIRFVLSLLHGSAVFNATFIYSLILYDVECELIEWTIARALARSTLLLCV